MNQPQDQRSAPRFDVRQPVVVGSAWAEATNLSESGIFFETHLPVEVGSVVDVRVDFTSGGRKHHLQCEGRVVRVEPRGLRMGVAAELFTPVFAGAEESR